LLPLHKRNHRECLGDVLHADEAKIRLAGVNRNDASILLGPGLAHLVERRGCINLDRITAHNSGHIAIAADFVAFRMPLLVDTRLQLLGKDMLNRHTRPISDMARVQPQGAGIVNFTADHILWYHRRHDNSIILAFLQRLSLPAEIINHKAWVYYHFCLSYRDVEELMATRGSVRAYADTVK
jgi:hypothetical protein